MNEAFRNLLSLPPLGSQQGADVDRFIFYVHWLMVLLFAGWLVYFAYTLWRFRASKNPRASHEGATGHTTSYIEVAVITFESVLLLVFAIPWWAAAVEKFPPEKDSTVIRVTGRQFNWLGRYPGADGEFGRQDIKLISAENPLGVDKSDPKAKDDFDVNGEFVVPVNKPVIAQISSLDVIHSFKLPSMRMTQDAIPGMRIPVHFVPTVTNTYQIFCAQLCGNGHSNMKGVFKVVSPEAYAAWVKSKAGGTASFE
jgi:cytochrome c oxidase subunit 2